MKSHKTFFAVVAFCSEIIAHQPGFFRVNQSCDLSDTYTVNKYSIRNIQAKKSSYGKTVSEFEYVPDDVIKPHNISWRAVTYGKKIVCVGKSQKYEFPRCKSDMPVFLRQLKAASDAAGDYIESLKKGGFSVVKSSQTLTNNSTAEKNSSSSYERNAIYVALFIHGGTPEPEPIYCVLKNVKTGVYCLVSARLELYNDDFGRFVFESSIFLNNEWFSDLSKSDIPTTPKFKGVQPEEEDLRLGMKFDVNDSQMRRKFKMSNFMCESNMIGFDYIPVGGLPEMSTGSGWTCSATVKDGHVNSIQEAVMFYFDNDDEVLKAFNKAANVYALRIGLDNKIVGSRNSIPIELMRSKPLQVAESMLGSNASEQEKAFEALYSAFKLGIPPEIFIVTQVGSVVKSHEIKIGKNKRGQTYVAAIEISTNSIDVRRYSSHK